MKIKFKNKKGIKINLSQRWARVVMIFAMGTMFIAGMLFYRSGYASKIIANTRLVFSNEDTSSELINDVIEEVSNEVNTEIKLYQANGLATIFLDIPFDSMLTIEEKRDEALKYGILLSSDDDYVPASMRFMNEEPIDIKMRLKGDWVDHLKTDKWSYRIHITDNSRSVLNMRRFSVQAPETRNFVLEWGFHQNLFLEGLLTTRYHFVNLVVNGEQKGIFALEEHFSEDLLESQERRAGVIIRLDEDLLWENWVKFFYHDYDFDFYADSSKLGYFMVTGISNAEITPFRQGNINQDEVLSAEFKTAVDLLYSFIEGRLPAEEVFDQELWGKYFALTDLWGAGHSTAWHNLRFYYNPITGLLEPVNYDAVPMYPGMNREQIAYPFSESETKEIFNNPGVQKAYIATLERITQPGYLELLENEFGEETAFYYELLAEEYGDREGFIQPLLPWESLAFRADTLFRNIHPAQAVRGYYHVETLDGGAKLHLDLINLMVVPIQINEIVIGDTVIPYQQEFCPPSECEEGIANEGYETVFLPGEDTANVPIPITIPIDGTASEEILSLANISVSVSLYGGAEKEEILIYSNYVPQGIEASSVPDVTWEETLAAHEFLIKVSDTQLVVAQGIWDVTGDLIIPEGFSLAIPEDTTLRFEEESVFLAHGNLEFLGSEEAPILLTAQNASWGGLVVLNAESASNWRYVKVEKMRGVERDGWILTGGVTFYQSPVVMTKSIIGNNETEDALNIVRSKFTLDQVEFLNTMSDAFDGDFSDGDMIGCSFHDIAGDGVDVSGSEVNVEGGYYINIGDKAFSAGEMSNLTISNSVIRNVGIGIASKDLSNVHIDSSTIDSAKVAAIAAYTKKAQYGPASIYATNMEIHNTDTTTILQTESYIELNGKVVNSLDIDVDSLYEQEILGN